MNAPQLSWRQHGSRLALLLIAAVAGLLVATSASADDRGRSDSLTGAWIVRFGADATAPESYSQYTFFPDGTVMESDSQIDFPTPLGSLIFSDGVGQWTKTGKDTYVVRYQKMGKPDGINTIVLLAQSTLTLTYDRKTDSFTGDLAISIYDGEGTFLFPTTQGSGATGLRLPRPSHGQPIDQLP